MMGVMKWSGSEAAFVCLLLAWAMGAWATPIAFRDSTGKVDFFDSAASGAHAMPPGAAMSYGKADGITFNVVYEDITSNNDRGFDDPATGAARQARVGEIFTYLNTVLNHTAVCDVVFRQSQTDGSGPLATGGTYYWITPGWNNGFAFAHITTGVDPDAGTPDISVTVDFGWPWYQDTESPSGSQIDLSSVLLHELTHGLGITSLASASGSSVMTAGEYSKWDDFIETGTGVDLFAGSPPAFRGVAGDLLGARGGVRFHGPAAMAAFGSMPPIYAPSSWQQGSSISHWNSGIAGGAVMEPSISFGEVMRQYAPADRAALEDIGYQIVIPPSVTVVVPNGGEAWMPGTPHAITWTSTGLGGNARIYLYSSWTKLGTLGTAPMAAGSWNWTIPGDQAVGATYRIRVQSMSSPAISDYSDGLSVIGGPPSVTVTSPNGGEAWMPGTPHAVTWNVASLTGNARVYLYDHWTKVRRLGDADAAMGTYTWNIPGGETPGTRYRIRVQSLAITAIQDYSDSVFTISPPP